MRVHQALVALLLAAAPGLPAEGLPDLGDVSQGSVSPAFERRMGESIMREVRADRRYLDDAEAADYLNRTGLRLVSASTDARQAFEFFLIDDPSLNAFALPGGFVGVHTGLIVAAQSESELAGVLAHEIAHVTQRHIARIIGVQERAQITSLAAMALAILAARSNSQVSQAVMTGSQAAGIQSLLDFTREHEREADRVGLQILEKAGFDVRAMPVLFERMQRASRFNDGGSFAYLRTHPLTYERIADIQNRIQEHAYRQVPDNPDYQMLRARFRAALESPREAVAHFDEVLREGKYSSEAATRYGLVTALMRQKDHGRALAEFERLARLAPAHPMVATMGGRLADAVHGQAAGLKAWRAAHAAHPRYRAIVYEYADSLLAARMPGDALKVVDEQQQFHPGDPRLYLLQARAHALLGNRLMQHKAQGEAYVRMGNLVGAVEQFQFAQRAADGDFFQQSSVDARLRELKQLEAESRRKP